VDQEVSKTLGELERKLQELERTLTSIDRGEQPSSPATPEPLHEGRLVDQTGRRGRSRPLSPSSFSPRRFSPSSFNLNNFSPGSLNPMSFAPRNLNLSSHSNRGSLPGPARGALRSCCASAIAWSAPPAI
jgi:hypothetical protein